ncbi:hypothetical protein GOP47_0002045 [Adiantum capillus-veneris]|uniref:glucan endo-1,3-beta-D-glucosidase n=1 Tax=Adiantum capillus-veneris TaxID=13818 RepID=A0A9D4VBA7_ADICA|nr:hypothetical protein GOP47_0002045 [Adiantum capillus-veneris]
MPLSFFIRTRVSCSPLIERACIPSAHQASRVQNGEQKAGIPGQGEKVLSALNEDKCEALNFGINYGMVANNLPTPADVVTLLQAICVSKAKLYDADRSVLSTFTNTGISFIVGIPNQELGALASASQAFQWVQENVAAHLPDTHISAIVVGNEIFSTNDTTLMGQVLPAMRNIYLALSLLNLHHDIIVSTAHSFSIVTTSYPPSSGQFNPAIATTYMKPMLEFLSKTKAPFFINVYPFFPYKENPKMIPIEYALFKPNPGVQDPKTSLHYTNMFDAQLDAVYFAIEALGYHNITLLVSETGWPSAGDENEVGANIENAKVYHQNLMKHISLQHGTPLHPNTSLEVYFFALFNEDMKPGPGSERNYGLFKPDGTMVYEFQFFNQPNASSSCSSLHFVFTLFLYFPTLMHLIHFHL